MRQTPAKLLIYLVLIFQLAIGMHLTAASATSMTAGADNGTTGSRHCAVHHAPQSGPALTHNQVTTGKAFSSPHVPMRRHACCGLAGCECHCTYAPVLFDTSIAHATAPTAVPLPGPDTRIDNTRTDELFRPPIV